MEQLCNTLDEALDLVAARSLEESVTVYPVTLANPTGFSVVGYWVEDEPEPDPFDVGDGVVWTYDGPLDWPRGITEHSRVFEACGIFSRGHDIRCNMEDSVAALMDGHAVTFSHVIVLNESNMGDMDGTDDEEMFVEPCGWALVAKAHEDGDAR